MLAQKSTYAAFLVDAVGLAKFYRTGMAEKDGPGRRNAGRLYQRCNLPDAFVEDHLLPMGAAIWSCLQKRWDYPVRSFLQFMDNHLLMDFTAASPRVRLRADRANMFKNGR